MVVVNSVFVEESILPSRIGGLREGRGWDVCLRHHAQLRGRLEVHREVERDMVSGSIATTYGLEY